MRITIDIGRNNTVERDAHAVISAEELVRVHFHLASPELRNRTGLYMRRHPLPTDTDPNLSSTFTNIPVRHLDEPDKLSVEQHIARMRRKGAIPPERPPTQGNAFATEPVMLAASLSDTVANLLRPAFHRNMPGKFRIFHFDAEPITSLTYFCVCFFEAQGREPRLEMRRVRFDVNADRVRDAHDGVDLMDRGLVWAAALVPLIENGLALNAVDIARHDYDLRHTLGRDGPADLAHAYSRWFDEWDCRVSQVVTNHMKQARPFASFYHSILAIDASNAIHVVQQEGTLLDIANGLHRHGMVGAGILDSGGSCSLYDPWLGSYLNHGWYYRWPRGGILVFELRSVQRIPRVDESSWFCRTRKV